MFHSYINRTSLRDSCNERRLFIYTLKIVSNSLKILLILTRNVWHNFETFGSNFKYTL
jgi:hypothetical protein